MRAEWEKTHDLLRIKIPFVTVTCHCLKNHLYQNYFRGFVTILALKEVLKISKASHLSLFELQNITENSQLLDRQNKPINNLHRYYKKRKKKNETILAT